MSPAEGEKLAPVTWLFGSPAEPAAPSDPPSAGTSARAHEVAAGADVADAAAARWAVPVIGPAGAGRDTRSQEDTSGRRTVDEVAADIEEVLAQKTPRSDGSFGRISNVSMHALARRGVSSAEMTALLTSREFDTEDVDAEVQRLEAVGLLDDAELARTLVTRLRERKGFGRTAIVAELRRRKIDAVVIETVLADDTDDELARALEVARRRAPQLRSLDREVAQRRLAGFLQRKGYSGPVVSAAVKGALQPTGPVFR